MFNTTTWTKPTEVERKWYLIDAKGIPLGRLASVIAVYLTGKLKPNYVPNVDMGDYVVVINVDKIAFTGKKLEYKELISHSGYPGGLKRERVKELMKINPKKVLLMAVKRMLPKNKLRAHYLKRLKMYIGDKHPHIAQTPNLIEIKDV